MSEHESSPPLRPTHLDEAGNARMVDVTAKDSTRRVAVASGWIRMAPETLTALVEDRTPKGEAMTVARIAGIQAGKRTDQLIPLCHALPGASVSVELEPDDALPGVRCTAEARYAGKTGVEMEALTAVSVTLLTLYDMLKALDRGMEMGEIRLERKAGGASGDWARPSP